MRSLQVIALGLFLSLVSFTGAFAQCGTQAPANKFCGNDTGSQALANWKTIPAGALSPINGGTVIGNPTAAMAVPIATTAPVLGIPGTSTGQIGLAGLTGGTAILRAQATAGSAISLLPTVAGTLVGSSSAPLVIGAATGTLTCPTCVTSSGGGAITGTAPISVSAAGVVSINAPYGTLVASNGGIVYSGATNLAILAGTATARQMLQSGATTTPAWSTATWPATTTINQILYSSAANVVGGLATANSSVLVTDSGGVPSLSTTLPALTLGGTISGGGNQINNVIIGTTTPLAGNFTTLNSGVHTITSASVSALTVGLNGATSPAFQVDASTALQATGIKITGFAAGGGAAIGAISTGTNEPMAINAKGSGAVNIANSSSGAVIIGAGGGGTTISNALTYGGVTLANSVSGTGSMALTAGTTFTGTTTIATLAATTINAFTLGGTISGGGNQLNNIVIGTTTPLAGSFTTLSASTSITSPLHYGGSAAGSTHTVNGTSNGSPSSAFVLLQSGTTQFVGINNAAPKTTLDLNVNTASSPALVVASSVARMQAADSANSGMEWSSYGGASPAGGFGNILAGIAAAGTSATPLASGTGGGQLSMFNLRGYGYNGTSFQLGAIMIMRNDSLWSGTNQATAFDFYTTPTTSTTVTRQMILQPSGGLSIGTTTDPGVGSLLVNKTYGSVPTTFASLVTCNAAAKGFRAFITDELAAVAFNTAATGGGANNVPVFCDGTVWRIG